MSHNNYNAKLFRNPPTMIDAGARYGDFAIPYFQKHGGRVICIEPYQPSLKILYGRGGFGFEVIEKALWTDDKGIQFYSWDQQTDANSCFHKNKKWEAEVLQVETIALDDILETIEWVDLLKLDVEGSEFAVLEQSKLLESKVGQIVAELHYWRFDDVNYQSISIEKLIEILGEKNFHTPLAGMRNGFANIHATNKSLPDWDV